MSINLLLAEMGFIDFLEFYGELHENKGKGQICDYFTSVYSRNGREHKCIIWKLPWKHYFLINSPTY